MSETNFIAGATTAAFSGVALAGGLAPIDAQAQDGSGANNLKLTLKGGIATSSFTENFWEEGEGASEDKLGHDVGFYGSAAVTGPAFDDWDWRVRGQFTGFPDNEYDDIDGDDTARIFGNGRFGELDFDIGRTFQTNLTNVRVAGGIRAADFSQTFGKGLDIEEDDYFMEFDFTRKFHGFGPVFSLDLRTPLNPESGLDLLAGGSLSLLKGTNTYSFDFYEDDDGSITDEDGSDDDDADWISKSVYLAVGKQFGDNAQGMIGVRLQQLDDQENDSTPINPVDFMAGFVGYSVNF